MVRRRREDRLGLWVAGMLLLSLVLHVPLVRWFANETYFRPAPEKPDQPIHLTLLSMPSSDEEEVEEEEVEEEEPQGQIVEVVPDREERPEEADFLAEADSSTDEQTVDPRYRLDREVLAETYSPDDVVEVEEAVPMETTHNSTGATAGSQAFERGEFSLFSDRSSPFRFTNKEGLQEPVLSSHTRSLLAGSPSNDYMPEITRADRTSLNTHEYLFAAWWNRVKRYVSFYAGQTLANADPRVPITKPKYRLLLTGLIALDGTIHALDIISPSGVPAFDEAIREAFELAAPFPDPPEAAAEGDGFIHMRGFEFVIEIGRGRVEMMGIDPRHNVQFPGLETVPR